MAAAIMARQARNSSSVCEFHRIKECRAGQNTVIQGHRTLAKGALAS
jgi:hypothetical protein